MRKALEKTTKMKVNTFVNFCLTTSSFGKQKQAENEYTWGEI